MIIPSIFGASSIAELMALRSIYPVSNYNPYSNGTDDDLPAFRACVDACFAAGGGYPFVDVPLWFLGSSSVLWDATTTGVSNLTIIGSNDGAVITVNCPTITPFFFANFYRIQFDSLTILGTADTTNCSHLFYGGAHMTAFTGCDFAHIGSADSTFGLLTGTAYFDRCRLGSSGPVGGPAVIDSAARLYMTQNQFFDFIDIQGTNWSGKTNLNYPWVQYLGNGTGGVQPGGQGPAIYWLNNYWDENAINFLKVAKLVGGDPNIRNVVIKGGGGNCPVLQTPIYDISGVDSVVIDNGDYGWNRPNPFAKFRDCRSVHLERVTSDRGLPADIDVNGTVTFLKIMECPNLTVLGTPGLLLHQFNGVDV